MLDLQNAEIFRAALESLYSGVCVVDRDRKINFWNDGAERITGYLRQEVMGRFCGDILLIKSHEKKAALCEQSCPLVAAMRDGRIRESRVYLHHKSGYAVPVRMRAVPIRDVHGHVIGVTESFVVRSWMSTRRRPDSGLVVGHGLDALTELPDYDFTEFIPGGSPQVRFPTPHSFRPALHSVGPVGSPEGNSWPGRCRGHLECRRAHVTQRP